MRKKYKRKLGCCCGLCHPNKVGWESRWTPSELQAIREFESIRKQALTDYISYLYETGQRVRMKQRKARTYYCQP